MEVPDGSLIVTDADAGAVAPLYCPVTRTDRPERAQTVLGLNLGSARTGDATSGLAPGQPGEPSTPDVAVTARPPPLRVTHRASSVVATQRSTVAHDTLPTSFGVSAVCADQLRPPFEVPSRAS